MTSQSKGRHYVIKYLIRRNGKGGLQVPKCGTLSSPVVRGDRVSHKGVTVGGSPMGSVVCGRRGQYRRQIKSEELLGLKEERKSLTMKILFMETLLEE